jgi:hypothetical protein
MAIFCSYTESLRDIRPVDASSTTYLHAQEAKNKEKQDQEEDEI